MVVLGSQVCVCACACFGLTSWGGGEAWVMLRVEGFLPLYEELESFTKLLPRAGTHKHMGIKKNKIKKVDRNCENRMLGVGCSGWQCE